MTGRHVAFSWFAFTFMFVVMVPSATPSGRPYRSDIAILALTPVATAIYAMRSRRVAGVWCMAGNSLVAGWIAWSGNSRLGLSITYQGVARQWIGWSVAFAWLCIIGRMTAGAVWLARDWRWRRGAGLCCHCGYDLRASPDRCPECGRPVRD